MSYESFPWISLLIFSSVFRISIIRYGFWKFLFEGLDLTLCLEVGCVFPSSRLGRGWHFY